MYLGIDTHTGLVYEGLGAPDTPSIPAPYVTQAKLIREQADWKDLPKGLSGTPMAWVFREDFFDPVNRTRRGRLFESQPGQGQPNSQRVGPHPYENTVVRQVGHDGRIVKTLYTFTTCSTLLGMLNQGQGMKLVLGSNRAHSAWRIIQTEVSATGYVLVTLKSLSAFAILPEIDYAQIDSPHQAAVRDAIQRVLDSAFRESPTSVVDHCRAALTVLLSRWLVQNGADKTVLGLDLGMLATRIDGKELSMGCPSRVAQVVARLHSRGKPNERHAKGYREPDDGDSEFALQAVGLVLRDFGWATI